MRLGSKSVLLFFSVEERLANYGLRAKENHPMSDPVSRALLELSHTIGLHVVYGCTLTTEAEMSRGNTDPRPTEHVPSDIYGKLANSYSGTLVSSKKSCGGFCNWKSYSPS